MNSTKLCIPQWVYIIYGKARPNGRVKAGWRASARANAPVFYIREMTIQEVKKGPGPVEDDQL